MDDLYIRKVLQGDTDAFRWIIKNHKDMAYSLAMSVVKDEYIAREVLQTSFVKAYTKLDTFLGRSKFSTWFFRIVIHESFKALKKRSQGIVEYGELPVHAVSETEDVTLKLEQEDLSESVHEALKRLSPKESLALRLFYLDENSIEEISEITGWTGSNIKVLLHRARKNMREILGVSFQIDRQNYLS